MEVAPPISITPKAIRIASAVASSPDPWRREMSIVAPAMITPAIAMAIPMYSGHKSKSDVLVVVFVVWVLVLGWLGCFT